MNKQIKGRRTFINVVSAILFCTILGVFYQLYQQESITIEALAVNIRKGPGITYDITSQATRGETLEILSKENDWFKIKNKNGTEGWIASWLTSGTKNVTKINLPAKTKKKVSLQESPKSKSQYIKSLEKDSLVTIVGEENFWSHVIVSELEGWIPTKYLELTVDDTTPQKIKQNFLYAAQNNTKIRTTPSIDSDILDTLEEGDKVDYLETDNDWYKVKTSSGKIGYVASWVVNFNPSYETDNITSIAEATVMLDPGHGGIDPGAHTNNEQLYEKTVTLQTALLVKKELEKEGARVIMSRESDIFIPLAEIAEQSNQNNVNVFISFHFDSSESNNHASGTTTYFYDKKDQKLADIINQQLKGNLPLDNRGVEFGDFQVLRDNQQPALLLELGYLNNDRDAYYIQTNHYQKQIAKAIVKGLTEYFNQ